MEDNPVVSKAGSKSVEQEDQLLPETSCSPPLESHPAPIIPLKVVKGDPIGDEVPAAAEPDLFQSVLSTGSRHTIKKVGFATKTKSDDG